MALTCSICLDSIVSNGETVATKCGHVFHTNCLNRWTKNNNTCPECRNKVNDHDQASSNGMFVVTRLDLSQDGIESIYVSESSFEQESESESESESEPESESESEQESEQEPEPESVQESEPESEQESEPEFESEQEPESLFESEPSYASDISSEYESF